MEEIKRRTAVVNAFLEGKIKVLYPASSIESVGLQYRKMFELIAFASLAANHRLYSETYSDFAKHWEAAKLIKNLRQINPNFFPRPVIETPHANPLVMNGFKVREGDVLTQEELITAHGRCGALMHATNPFAKEIDYGYYRDLFGIWIAKIVNLLNNQHSSSCRRYHWILFSAHA